MTVLLYPWRKTPYDDFFSYAIFCNKFLKSFEMLPSNSCQIVEREEESERERERHIQFFKSGLVFIDKSGRNYLMSLAILKQHYVSSFC